MGVPYVKLASAVSVAAVVGAVVFNAPANAAPTAFTWTGAAGDHKMSTAGNWKDGQVPTEGAKLVFTCANGASEKIQNDLNVALSGLSVSKMNNADASPTCASYTIDTLKFTPDAEFSGDKTSVDDKVEIPYIYVTGAVTGLSNLKSNGFDGKFKNETSINRFEVANSGCNSISNSVKASEKIVGENASVPLEGANNITVKSSGELGVKYADNETSASKITFENGAMISHGISCLGSGGGSSNVTTVLSGDIVLNGNVEYKLLSNVTVKITGKLSGPGKLVAHKDNKGTLLVESSDNTSGTPNGQHGNAHEAKLIKLDGNKPNEPVNVKKGETIFISGGTGSLGAMAIPIAKNLGLVVYTNGNAENEERVKKLGVDRFINYKKENYVDILKDMDYVLDTLGDKELPNEFKILKKGGKLVSLRGMPNGRFAKRAGLSLLKQYLFKIAGRKYDKMASLKNQTYDFIFVHEEGEQLGQIGRLFNNSNPLETSIDTVFKLEEINEALEKVRQGRSNGKTIIKIREE